MKIMAKAKSRRNIRNFQMKTKTRRDLQKFQVKNQQKTISKSKMKKIKKETKVFTSAKNPKPTSFDFVLTSLGLNPRGLKSVVKKRS